MTQNTEQKRNKAAQTENMTFRYLYAFGVLFVVLSHCDGGGVEMLSNWFHFGAFHISVFVFGSGYFFRKEAVRNPLKYGWKKIQRLILPLWLIHFVYGFILILLHKMHFTFGDTVNLKSMLLYPVISKDLFTLDLGAWFVFPFFMVQMVYFMGKILLDTLHREKATDIALQVLLFLLGLACVWLSVKGILANKILIRIAYFMPFYILGMWYREYCEEKLQKVPATLIFALCMTAALLLNFRFGRVVYAIPSECDYPFGLVATYLSAVLGILFWLTVSRELAKADDDIFVLKLIGKNTWSIMFHQFAGIMLVKALFAMANSMLGCFADFNFGEYYGNIWYLYLPKGLNECKLLYVVGAVAFSVAVHQIYLIIKKAVLRTFSCAINEQTVSDS